MFSECELVLREDLGRRYGVLLVDYLAEVLEELGVGLVALLDGVLGGHAEERAVFHNRIDIINKVVIGKE